MPDRLLGRQAHRSIEIVFLIVCCFESRALSDSVSMMISKRLFEYHTSINAVTRYIRFTRGFCQFPRRLTIEEYGRTRQQQIRNYDQYWRNGEEISVGIPYSSNRQLSRRLSIPNLRLADSGSGSVGIVRWQWYGHFQQPAVYRRYLGSPIWQLFVRRPSG